MELITDDFIERIIKSGDLAEAQIRIRGSVAHPRVNALPKKLTTWTLICEEITDTEHESDWYDTVIAELLRRGFSYEQIDQMRRFAWRTAGWLNYDCVLWEWVFLDEKHIQHALDLQLETGRITPAQHHDGLLYLADPTGAPPTLQCSGPEKTVKHGE